MWFFVQICELFLQMWYLHDEAAFCKIWKNIRTWNVETNCQSGLFWKRNVVGFSSTLIIITPNEFGRRSQIQWSKSHDFKNQNTKHLLKNQNTRIILSMHDQCAGRGEETYRNFPKLAKQISEFHIFGYGSIKNKRMI